MTDSAQSLAAHLEKEGQKNVEFFRSVSPEAWLKQIYSDGDSWTVLEILMHIVETERAIPDLIRSILDGGTGVSDDFDLDRYNESRVRKTNEQNAQVLIAMFAERRAATVELVTGLTNEQLTVMGNHPFLGHTQIIEMFRLMYLHIKLHIRDIKRATA